jgi:hypothetical protein
MKTSVYLRKNIDVIALLCGAIVASWSCTGRDIVARVGSIKVTRGDLEAFTATRSKKSVASSRETLDSLVARTLLAEGARRDDIDDDPVVHARLAAARREVLAQAFLEKKLANAAEEGSLRKRYGEKKSELAKKQIHVRQIVSRISEPGNQDAVRKARSRINEIYARLAGGEAFEVLARASSDDAAFADKGGDLGPLTDGQVDPIFFAKAAEQLRGTYSKPFETAFGFHIVQAIEDPIMVTPTFEEARGKLAAEARREAEEKLLKDLRERISVKVYGHESEP